MDEIQDGHTAQRILDDPVFQRAVQMADEDFVQQWRFAKTPEGRERAHALQAALAEVVRQLEIIVGGGAVAAARK